MVLVDYIGIFLHVAIILATYCSLFRQKNIYCEGGSGNVVHILNIELKY